MRVRLLFLLFLCLVALSIGFVLSRDDSREGAGGRKRNFTVGMSEGLSLRRSGYYGIDFIRCGKCRIEKRKLGNLTLGGLNVLVLEDLAVVIPPDLAADGGKDGKADVSAADLAAGLGIDEDFLRVRGAGLKFSGLRIRGFSVSTLDAATNVVPRFVAQGGDAKTDGLHLTKCGIISKNDTNWVESAVLKVRPTLRLIWSDGEIDFLHVNNKGNKQ